jgi:hypothetical protein
VLSQYFLFQDNELTVEQLVAKYYGARDTAVSESDEDDDDGEMDVLTSSFFNA